jgi:Ca-activated chloride channel family protein
MNVFFLRAAYPWLIAVLVGVIFVVMYLRKKLHKQLLYQHSLGSFLKKSSGFMVTHPHRTIMYIVRFLILCLLAIAIGKLQLVDSRSKIAQQGIDIMLVLDVSGSMQFQDYEDDARSRFDVAKAEAIRFVEKRHNDSLGLVLFGKETLSRCPITEDKLLLRQTLEELKLGFIDADGTMLVTGIVTAANRLKNSLAKSKVMIVLTDGEPTEGDIDVSVGIEIAKKLGIKIYTVGIGNEQDVVFMHPLYGVVTKSKVNKELLTQIASQTGGQYFLAHSAADMRRVYDIIDKLERTEREVPVFNLFYDLGLYCAGVALALIMVELIISTFVWFAL